jgi:hypothetical protein
LGVLLGAVSCGLKALPTVELPETPRMADFAKRAVACEVAFWEVGSFLQAFTANAMDATEAVIEADSVATAIAQFMKQRVSWVGTATQLLDALNDVSEKSGRRDGWPSSHFALGKRVQRASGALRSYGIATSHCRKSGERQITFKSLRVETQNQLSELSSLSPKDAFSSSEAATNAPPIDADDSYDSSDNLDRFSLPPANELTTLNALFPTN